MTTHITKEGDQEMIRYRKGQASNKKVPGVKTFNRCSGHEDCNKGKCGHRRG